jgi:hypothetical protein
MGGLFKGLVKKSGVTREKSAPTADEATLERERKRADARQRKRLGRSDTVLGTSDTLGP